MPPTLKPNGPCVSCENVLDPAAECNGHVVRYGAENYAKLGFLPESDNDQLSASITLEYATADFAISRFAGAVGDQDLSAALSSRSSSWLRLWDSSSRHIRPRMTDGTWMSPFHPESGLGFTEGNSEQYSWLVPYNLGGLLERMGERPKCARVSTTFFRNSMPAAHHPICI